MLAELRSVLDRFTCLFLAHRIMVWGPVEWLNFGSNDIPAQRAICQRCDWRGYRTTTGALLAGRIHV